MQEGRIPYRDANLLDLEDHFMERLVLTQSMDSHDQCCTSLLDTMKVEPGTRYLIAVALKNEHLGVWRVDPPVAIPVHQSF